MFCRTFEITLPAFPSSCMIKSWFSYVHYLRSKQRRILAKESGDLLLKLTNLQTNARDFSAHQNTYFYRKIIQELKANLHLWFNDYFLI